MCLAPTARAVLRFKLAGFFIAENNILVGLINGGFFPLEHLSHNLLLSKK